MQLSSEGLKARHLLFNLKQETGREYTPHPHHQSLREIGNS